jgi:PPOX class probable F420-dependent enzyme
MPYRAMSSEEVWAFLDGEVRPAILSTVRADGRPHAAPVWYVVDERTLVFNTGDDTVKGRNIARDPRVSMCVQDDRPPFAFVIVEGIAALTDDGLLEWATQIGGRYMGAAQAAAYGARNGVPGELVVRVTPTKIISALDVAH